MTSTLEWYDAAIELPLYGSEVLVITQSACGLYSQDTWYFDYEGNWYRYYLSGIDAVSNAETLLAWAYHSDISEVIRELDS